MAEYIEREAHCKKCIHYDICDSYSGLDIITFFPHNEDCEYFRETADVVEVRHGEWLKRHRGQKSPEGYYYWNTPLTTVFVCSECGRHEDKQEPYCHCGAKMDGKGEGE